MKKLFTFLAIATGFAVMAPAASQAHDFRGNSGHNHNFWHNCSTCGAPMYRERVMIGRDRFGHPIFGWRTVPHQHVYHRHGGPPMMPAPRFPRF